MINEELSGRLGGRGATYRHNAAACAGEVFIHVEFLALQFVPCRLEAESNLESICHPMNQHEEQSHEITAIHCEDDGSCSQTSKGTKLSINKQVTSFLFTMIKRKAKQTINCIKQMDKKIHRNNLLPTDLVLR